MQTGLTILHFLVLVLVFVAFLFLSLLIYAVAARRRVIGSIVLFPPVSFVRRVA